MDDENGEEDASTNFIKPIIVDQFDGNSCPISDPQKEQALLAIIQIHGDATDDSLQEKQLVEYEVYPLVCLSSRHYQV